MIHVAHRGNFKGKNEDLENNPEYLFEAINSGYYVETDVWLIGDDYYLGHDYPKYKVPEYILCNEKIICHAKSIDTFLALLQNKLIHCFFHDKDYCTLTSNGWVWKYPEIYLDGKIHGYCADSFNVS